MLNHLHPVTRCVEAGGHPVLPEVSPGDHGFLMHNDAGTEVEVSEFLHALVRVLKPQLIVETGTHKGISSAYMAHALMANGRGGVLHTFEIFDVHIDEARRLIREMDLEDFVVHHHQPSLTATPESFPSIDLLMLDSEPQLRFDEFVRFFDSVRPGGFILIHDLHPHLGHTGIEQHGEMDWPYGDFRQKLGPYILDHRIQTVTFPTPRGLTMFQKAADDFAATSYLKGTLA